MAATLLPLPEHHFGSITSQYTPGIFDHYTASPGTHIRSNNQVSPTTSEHYTSYTSPQRWTAQQAFHRRTSNSPNTSIVRDRTSIRHHRPDMSRHRRTSRPDVLLAYAEEQARQVQHCQPETTRPMFVSSMEPTMQSYQPQQYGYPPVTAPFVHQQSFFDTTNPQASYAQLQDTAHANAMYATGRSDMHMSQLAGTTLNPNDTLYSQPRGPQLPSMASVPSNFPPVPQPLESTPNDVDIIGSRQKPQCWDHGCNGRQFSTFSNLLRHQREKSGTATKARCPHCGTEFTRTTARNGHLFGGKCKGMPNQIKEGTKQTKDEIA